MTDWIEKAKEKGFDTAATLDPKTLTAREDVRSMCAADKCGAYNKNWTCPPVCGSLEECQRKMRGFERGILLQSIGHMRKSIDSQCYRETERRHMQNFYDFAEEIRKAVADNCSYLNIGPMFPTKTKSVSCGALGLAMIEELKTLVPCPFSIMGGIKEHHLPMLCAKGFKHIAMVTEITTAPDVTGKVRQLRKLMKESLHE